MHDEGNRQHQFELDVGDRCLDWRGEVGEGGNVNSLREDLLPTAAEALLCASTTLIVFPPG